MRAHDRALNAGRPADSPQGGKEVGNAEEIYLLVRWFPSMAGRDFFAARKEKKIELKITQTRGICAKNEWCSNQGSSN